MESEIERLRKKVENFPSASLYNRLAELERAAGNLAQAESICRRCFKEFPRGGQAYVILAEIQIKAGKREEAHQLLRSAVEKDPRCYQAHRLLADLLEKDHKDQALVHLRQILTFKPNDPEVMARISRLGGAAPAPAPAPAGPTPNIVPRPGGPAPGAQTAGSPATASANPIPFPQAATATALVRAISAGLAAPSRSKTAALDGLCAETGVRGALVADAQGRVVVAKNVANNIEEMLAALAGDLLKSASTALAAAGNPTLSSWSLQAAAGQVLTFTRDRTYSVVVLAEPSVRPAMLELRARQVLIDLGAN